jgi:hypothetical protein
MRVWRIGAPFNRTLNSGSTGAAPVAAWSPRRARLTLWQGRGPVERRTPEAAPAARVWSAELGTPETADVVALGRCLRAGADKRRLSHFPHFATCRARAEYPL